MTLSLKLMNSFRGNFLKTKSNMNRNENSIRHMHHQFLPFSNLYIKGQQSPNIQKTIDKVI